jgi:hypothetical protein
VNEISIRLEGGFLLTVENRTARINSPCAILSTINPTETGLGSNPCPLSEKLENRGILLVVGFQGFFKKSLYLTKIPSYHTQILTVIC